CVALTPSIRYQVSHDTCYQYAATVNSGRHFTHLSPRNTAMQQVISHELVCKPAPAERIEIEDYFGNHGCSILLNTPHDTLLVSARSEVEVLIRQHAVGLPGQAWESALPPALH